AFPLNRMLSLTQVVSQNVFPFELLLQEVKKRPARVINKRFLIKKISSNKNRPEVFALKILLPSVQPYCPCHTSEENL
ncbi:MAG TPA: hypothetical protein VNS32_19520, partial [Flavisolibacter sp.]|nr:hypothetical protein [Flavisolibacter sp.]